jgi:hypothetical protein
MAALALALALAGLGSASPVEVGPELMEREPEPELEERDGPPGCGQCNTLPGILLNLQVKIAALKVRLLLAIKYKKKVHIKILLPFLLELKALLEEANNYCRPIKKCNVDVNATAKLFAAVCIEVYIIFKICLDVVIQVKDCINVIVSIHVVIIVIVTFIFHLCPKIRPIFCGIFNVHGVVVWVVKTCHLRAVCY